jgi:hypothetical protein
MIIAQFLHSNQRRTAGVAELLTPANRAPAPLLLGHTGLRGSGPGRGAAQNPVSKTLSIVGTIRRKIIDAKTITLFV